MTTVNKPLDFENLIFGVHPVLEAIKSGQSIDKVLLLNNLKSPAIKEIIELIKEKGISLNKVPQEKLNRITRKNHQGIIAFTSPIEFQDIEALLPLWFEQGKTPFVLVLDRISDVRNFGAITRTAECAGVNAIIIPKKGSAQINAETIKTSTGALYNIPICKVPGIESVIPYLKNSGLRRVACTEKTDDNYTSADYTGPVAIIMGSEESGIAHSLINNCDARAKIPLMGKTGSLNVSVACGVILYEAVRQRMLNQ